MELYYATTNKGKLFSLQHIFAGYPVTIYPVPMEISEYQIDDVEKIALQKVQTVYDVLHKPVLAHDSGFYIDSLNGFPKAYAKFINETIGNEGILRLVKGKARTCSFRTAMAFMDTSMKQPKVFRADIPGSLAYRELGTMPENAMSALWLLFIPLNQKKTLAQMSSGEYRTWREAADTHYDASKTFRDWFIKNRVNRHI